MDMGVIKSADGAQVPVDSTFDEINRMFSKLGFIDYDAIGAQMPGKFHSTFCGSQCAHSYAIDELGNMYCCPHRHMVSGVRRCPWFKDDPDAYVFATTRAARKSRQ